MSAFADGSGAEEEEEYEEISAEEKLRIATHFLLSAPAGEARELLEDVRKVVGAAVLTEAALGNVFRTYNLENHTLAEVRTLRSLHSLLSLRSLRTEPPPPPPPPLVVVVVVVVVLECCC